MHLLNTLYVNTQDSYLRLDNDTLRVLVDEETRLRVPLHHLQAVVCFGRVGISLPLMHRLAEEAVALVLLDENGRFKARLEGATAGAAQPVDEPGVCAGHCPGLCGGQGAQFAPGAAPGRQRCQS